MKYIKSYQVFEFVDNEFIDIFLHLQDKGYSIKSDYTNMYKKNLNRGVDPENTYVCSIQKVSNGYVEFKIKDIYEDIEFAIKYLEEHGINFKSINLHQKLGGRIINIDLRNLSNYMDTDIIRIILNFVDI